MKVLLLAENWPPRVGGIENYLTHIAAGLSERSVTVVAPFAKKTKDNNQEAPANNGIKEVIRKLFFWPLIMPAWLPLFIWMYRWAKVERPQVILCGKALFEGLIGYYLKRHLGIPYVIFTYAMEIDSWAHSSSQRRKLVRVLRGASRVVYINDATRKILLTLGVTEPQLVKIWPGVDDRFFLHPDETQIARVLERYAVQRPYILAVARLIPRKGIDVLMEAFSKLDQISFANLTLVVVGDGPELSKLQRLAEHALLNPAGVRGPDSHQHRVLFLGHVSDEDLPAFYMGAELFALTPRKIDSDMEGFGIVYLEAAACGRAVIGTHSGGVPEAVVDRVTGLLAQSDSIDAVHEALVQILAHSQERTQMGEAGNERAWHQFRWQQRISLVKDMLDTVIAK